MQTQKKQKLILNNELFGVKSITPLFKKKEVKGIAMISQIHYTRAGDENILGNLRAIRDGGMIFRMYDGHYTRLIVDRKLVMSDTGMERLSNKEFIEKANGKVLIAGLGLGLIIYNIIDKKEVTQITVIEKHKDVIDLVAPKFKSKKLKVIHADIFDWTPKEKFDTIYFDIWSTISAEKNLPQIKTLHNKYKHSLNRKNPQAWMDSWMKKYLQKMDREEKAEAAFYRRLY